MNVRQRLLPLFDHDPSIPRCANLVTFAPATNVSVRVPVAFAVSDAVCATRLGPIPNGAQGGEG